MYIPAAARCVALKLRSECSKIAVSEVADVLSVVHRPSDIHRLCRFLNALFHSDSVSADGDARLRIGGTRDSA